MPLRAALQAVRAYAWRRSHKDFLIVLNWHQVTPLFDPQRHHKYTWTRLKDFAAAIDHLTAQFEIVPLHDALARLDRGVLRGACAALTFDDGDVSMAENVVPLLRERGLPATFFINSAYLDGRHSYWFTILSYLCAVEDFGSGAVLPHELKKNGRQLRATNDPNFYRATRERLEELSHLVPNLAARLVSSEWLANLDCEQFAIGAHGHEHQRFAMMPSEWQLHDLRENVRVLAQFRAYRPVFAVPFGRPWDWTKETIELARGVGLRVVLADGGINFRPADRYQRIPSDGRRLRPLITAAMAEALRNERAPA